MTAVPKELSLGLTRCTLVGPPFPDTEFAVLKFHGMGKPAADAFRALLEMGNVAQAVAFHGRRGRNCSILLTIEGIEAVSGFI
jgi:hypothetical protein